VGSPWRDGAERFLVGGCEQEVLREVEVNQKPEIRGLERRDALWMNRIFKGLNKRAQIRENKSAMRSPSGVTLKR
jgi:hypothetical protein